MPICSDCKQEYVTSPEHEKKLDHDIRLKHMHLCHIMKQSFLNSDEEGRKRNRAQKLWYCRYTAHMIHNTDMCPSCLAIEEL